MSITKHAVQVLDPQPARLAQICFPFVVMINSLAVNNRNKNMF